MSAGSDMDRSHREDYDYHYLCRDTEAALQRVLDDPRMRRQSDARKCRLWGAQELLRSEAAHVVSVWD